MRYIQIAFVGLLASFFLFPTQFAMLPSVNTKIMLSLLGIAIAVLNGTSNGGGMINKSIIHLSVYGAAFSLMCFISTVYNETTDYTYATYFVSMWIWAMAAYAVTEVIREVHGKVSFELVSKYLVGVCVSQCILALLIDNYPAVRYFIDSIFFNASDFYAQGGRLYGLGCALDPAGIRFSIVLVLLANLIVNVKERHNLQLFIYFLSFAIIFVIGNMMARTTIVGGTVSLAYIVFSNFVEHKVDGRVWKWFGVTLMIAIPLLVILYNINPSVRSDLRFGFEGFFSLVEKGHWETHSNNELEKMVRWPEETKTWIIGDGYFVSPWATNIYYIGNDFGVFYKNTDIGYCRFIFYCGILGLSVFSIFFTKVTSMCAELFPKRKLCLYTILLVNFIIWMKVATDNFLIFALLFFTDADEEEEENENETAKACPLQDPMTELVS